MIWALTGAGYFWPMWPWLGVPIVAGCGLAAPVGPAPTAGRAPLLAMVGASARRLGGR